MLPVVLLRPRGAAEIVIAVTAFLVAATLLSRAPSARDASSAHAWRFAGYLAAFVFAGLATHTALGETELAVGPYGVASVSGATLGGLLLVPRLSQLGATDRWIFLSLFGGLVAGLGGAHLASLSIDAGKANHVLSLYGALAGSAGSVAVLARWLPEVRLASVFDAAAPSAALALSVVRVGCLLAGCCYGARAPEGAIPSLPATAFAAATPAGRAAAAVGAKRLWATEPLEAGALLAVAVLAEIAYRKRDRLGARPGAIAAGSLAAYGAFRLLTARLRGDRGEEVLSGFTAWDLVVFASILGSLGWLLTRPSRTA